MKVGFDSAKYTCLQTAGIRERLSHFGGKLYLEVGGKLFDDYHAARVLPGFRADSKIAMLAAMKDETEAVVCVNCNDIAKSKVRGDLGITYDLEALRIIDLFRARDIKADTVVLTLYTGQPSAEAFRRLLRERGVHCFLHRPIANYPADTALIVSPDGYGRNDYVDTDRPLVVVTGPGPGSGKLAVCLSQIYQDARKGLRSGYAKYETFPVWNLPLEHPVNLAYEAATADLGDRNMVDPYHLAAYGKTAVNYNRDIESFPVLKALLDGVMGHCPYRSPTDMGIYTVGNCLSDPAAVETAARQEIVRRYFRTACDRLNGKADDSTVSRLGMLMNRAGTSPEQFALYRQVRQVALQAGGPVAGMELSDGSVVTGIGNADLSAVSAVLLNAAKQLGGLDTGNLLPDDVLRPIQKLRTGLLGSSSPRLRADETLLALAVSGAHDDRARTALEQMQKLRDCDIHCSVMMYPQDRSVLRKLGVNVTCEPEYATKFLFQESGQN
ncbi:MAG: DUF1846 domain-containing protein [Candidatus Methanomethylophilus sp.]|nr:DUF1846 domain-containing protein [Methanomethylophilus sp.]